MDIKTKAWLDDILNAILEIDGFFENAVLNFDAFRNDIKTQRAVERNIEIIGEALSRIFKQDSNIIITNSRKIIDARNRIIHGYDSVSEEIIWKILITHLPILKKEVLDLLSD